MSSMKWHPGEHVSSGEHHPSALIRIVIPTSSANLLHQWPWFRTPTSFIIDSKGDGTLDFVVLARLLKAVNASLFPFLTLSFSTNWHFDAKQQLSLYLLLFKLQNNFISMIDKLWHCHFNLCHKESILQVGNTSNIVPSFRTSNILKLTSLRARRRRSASASSSIKLCWNCLIVSFILFQPKIHSETWSIWSKHVIWRENLSDSPKNMKKNCYWEREIIKLTQTEDSFLWAHINQSILFGHLEKVQSKGCCGQRAKFCSALLSRYLLCNFMV